jgi:hypothetical protein
MGDACPGMAEDGLELSDACAGTEKAPTGFVCPPCGRFIRTDLDGVLFRSRTGSAPRFCSPGCRQAAYRRRRAGVGEDAPLQHAGGRARSLSRRTSGDFEPPCGEAEDSSKC